MICPDMHQIAVLSGVPRQSRVLLAAMTEAAVRHLVIRHDREILISMREKGREFLPDAEHTKAELIASNLARQYALDTAIQDPDAIPDAMELSVQAENHYCGRLRFYCHDPESAPEAAFQPDAYIVIVSAVAPQLAMPVVQKVLRPEHPAGVCIALFCDQKPGTAEQPEKAFRILAPELSEFLQDRACSFAFYNPCGFQKDGAICSADHASPLGALDLFWDSVRVSSEHRCACLMQDIQAASAVIRRRNSVYQAPSPRRRLELAESRHAYAQAVRALYEAQTLLAAESGAALTEPMEGKE